MKFVDYKNYGKCAKFERAGIICLVTLDLGPHIIYYGTSELNFMNEDLERNVQKSGSFFDETYKKGEKWYLYGGHRVWKSPEDMPTYTPDNYPVDFTPDADGFGGVFVCKVTTFYKYSLVVKMDKTGGLDVENIVENPVQRTPFAVWALSVLAKGGTLSVPLNDKVDDLNPSQNIVLWPYNDLQDERLKITHKTLTLRQTAKPEALKLGLLSKKGRAYYTLGDKTLLLSVAPPEDDGRYSDFGCNFETYTNQHILEMEWLGTLGCVEKSVLKQKWAIIDTPVSFE